MSLKKIAFSSAVAFFGMLASNRSVQRSLFNALRLNRAGVSEILQDENLRFLSYCLSRRPNSRAQIAQDLWVCFELGEKRDGYFVEFGSTDGLTNSNTWFLEKQLGWKGILAEPNPIWHLALSANRTACIEHRCVSSKSGETVDFVTTDDDDPELSGISAFSEGDHFAELRRKGRVIQVSTLSLEDLLTVHNAPAEVDYLSVDTEGSELEILKSYTFSRKFKLISVEHNRNTESKIQALLESNGYKRVFEQFSQWDGWYVSSELRDDKTIEIVAPRA